MLALGVRAGAEFVDGGVPDDPITVAEDLVAGVRAAGPNDALAMSLASFRNRASSARATSRLQ
jgi:hypothetical protein